MSVPFRILLIIGAAFALIVVVTKVKKGDLKTADSVFWVIFAALLVLIAIIPQLVYWLAELLRVQSPANLVFLILIVTLAVREFMMTLRVAHLRGQVVTLTQKIAIDEAERLKAESVANGTRETSASPSDDETERLA